MADIAPYFIGAIVGAVVVVMFKVIEHVTTTKLSRGGKLAAEVEMLKRVLTVVVRDRLRQMTESAIEMEEITFEEKEHLMEMWETYSSQEKLGKNGKVGDWVEDVRKLPTKKGRGKDKGNNG